MQRVVLTGSPGAGKTAVIERLSSAGHGVSSDAARSIIRERKQQGLSPRPADVEFAEEILRREIASYEAAMKVPTFFERSVVDVAGMLQSLGVLDPIGVTELIQQYSYFPTVFAFPPWQAIYTTDEERDQSYDHSVSVYQPTCDWYQNHGYKVIEMPRTTIQERTEFILSNI